MTFVDFHCDRMVRSHAVLRWVGSNSERRLKLPSVRSWTGAYGRGSGYVKAHQGDLYMAAEEHKWWLPWPQPCLHNACVVSSPVRWQKTPVTQVLFGDCQQSPALQHTVVFLPLCMTQWSPLPRASLQGPSARKPPWRSFREWGQHWENKSSPVSQCTAGTCRSKLSAWFFPQQLIMCIHDEVVLFSDVWVLSGPEYTWSPKHWQEWPECGGQIKELTRWDISIQNTGAGGRMLPSASFSSVPSVGENSSLESPLQRQWLP